MDLTQIALQRKDIRGNFMFSGVVLSVKKTETELANVPITF